MIKAERLEIHEFRGIRSLTLNLEGNNFAVCGPNGTGKSGIVDALEFVLTGNISRLSGKGTGELSIKEHAPHVDSRNNPDKARVILTAFIPSLGKSITIERSVKTADAVKITPNDKDVLNVIAQVAMHPEFALSRRELIRYVLSAPGDRAKEVQTLLRLDQIEELRTALQKIANACRRHVTSLSTERNVARNQLIKALEIPDLTVKRIIESVNPKRTLLALAPIETLTPKTSLKDGLATVQSVRDRIQRIPKLLANNDVKHLRESLALLASEGTQLQCEMVKKQFLALKNEPAILNNVTREKFLKTGLGMIEAEACPLCDTQWQPDRLRELIASKLRHLEKVALKRAEMEKDLENLIVLLLETKQALLAVYSYGALAKPPLDTSRLKQHASELEIHKQRLESFLPIDESILSLDSITNIPAKVVEEIDAIAKVVESIPEPTKQDAARDYLVICQERLEAFQDVSRRLKQADARFALSQNVHDIYAEVSTSVLNGIYKKVQVEFAELYKFINREDEGGFDARLMPSIGKLGFDVNFYGRGHFPPGAYHSEGHQDGMGLCLYLALMKYLLGDEFTFAVLDDVLMSVDSGHRREVCKLLKDKFPNTQFILTTHDGIWLRHMKSAGVIKPGSSIQFRRWSVDQGPTEWQDRDVWAEIDSHAESNDILGASSILRNYLEYISAELCQRLRAPVEFRGDAQFQLGDLFPNVIGKFRRLLKEAKKAAQSWGQDDIFALIAAREKDFTERVKESKVEEWQINPAIHYNEWADFGKEDFRPVVFSQRELITSLRCEKCNGSFYVLPERGTAEALRCDCGLLNLNLVSK